MFCVITTLTHNFKANKNIETEESNMEFFSSRDLFECCVLDPGKAVIVKFYLVC